MLFNKVKLAVYRAGGPTYVANSLNCSGTAVHAWIRQGRVGNLEKAKQLAALSGMDVLDIRPC